MFLRAAIGLGLVLLSMTSASASDLAYARFPSPALKGEIPAMVYTPDGKPPPSGWPVLYLLHGHDGNERSWTDLGHIQQTLDGLIAGQEIKPILVVMPGGGNGWYVDSEDVGGPGDFATAIARDLPAAVEGHYPVRRDQGGRAIAGLSMGGYGALRIALLHPDRYVATASLSGAIWQNIPPDDYDKSVEELATLQMTDYFHRVDPDTVTVGRVLPSVGTHFGGAYGVPFDARRFNRDNVFTILEQQIAAKARLPAIYVTCGDDDSFNLWRGAVAFYDTASAEKLTDVELRITNGDHVWSLWATEIVPVLHFVDHRWGPNPDPEGVVQP